jgi:hypothetical protein
MATKTAKVTSPAAYQELVGWSGGLPAIDKSKPLVKKEIGATFKVEDGVITSSAGQQVYSVLGTKYFVKVSDVTLS